jgi:hypothetical protein
MGKMPGGYYHCAGIGNFAMLRFMNNQQKPNTEWPLLFHTPGHPQRDTHVRWRRPSDGVWFSVRRSKRLMRKWRPNNEV